MNLADGSPTPQPRERPVELFYPSFLLKEALVALFIVFMLLALGLAIPMPEEPVADPTDNSYLPRPEWYFLFLFQLLKYFPGELEVLGIVGVPAVAVGFLALLPFIDTERRRGPWLPRLIIWAGVGGLAGVVLLTGLAVSADLKPERIQALLQWRGALIVAVVIVNFFASWMVLTRRTPQPDPVIRTVLAGGLATLSIVAIAVITVLTALTPSSTSADAQMPRGERVFRTACAECHRIKGEGGDRGPDLTLGSKREFDWLVKFLKNPQSVKEDSTMSPARLSEEDIRAATEFLLKLAQNAPAAPPTGAAAAAHQGPTPQSIATGQKLFTDKRCDYCHRVAGRGGLLGPDLSGTGKRREARWLQTYLVDPAALNPGTLKPRIELSRDEIGALADYLGSLR